MKYVYKIGVVLLLSVALSLQLKAQNLVPNYSFELHDSCPTWTGYFSGYVSLWFHPMLAYGGPDYYNYCAPPPPPDASPSVPFNTLGFQNARTGNAYAGLVAYYVSPNGREYIEVELLDSLRQDKHYCAGFYVNSPECLYPVIYGIDRLGMYFSNDSLIQTTPFWSVIPVTPQIENAAGNIIYDTANWVLISGVFTANGGERFVTIGNFRNDSSTMYNVMSYPRPSFCSSGGFANQAYYFIDDVFVYELPQDSTTCFDGVVVEEIKNENAILVYPNPVGNELRIRNAELRIESVEIYNAIGKIVYSQQSVSDKGKEIIIDASELNSGIYFVRVKSKERVMMAKFVKE